MLSKHLATCILTHFTHQPTNEQQQLIDRVSEFIVEPNRRKVFMIKGYAGTGKTTVVAAMVKALAQFEMKVELLAPTGRAAKVIGNYAGTNAYTIHKHIYIQRSSTDGFGRFVLNRNLASSTLFIVDEASMIAAQGDDSSIFGSGKLLSDLLLYVHNELQCKLLIIGDTAQLPPVGLSVSPALDQYFYTGEGYTVDQIELTEVVRQTAQSGILFNATALRELIAKGIPSYPQIVCKEYSDINAIGGADLIPSLTEMYDKHGIENSIVICRSNKRANAFNQGIRSQILFRDSEIATGDLIMIVKNNYFWLQQNKNRDFIANGDIAQIKKIKKYHERYGYRFAEVSIQLFDYEIPAFDTIVMLDTLTTEAPALPYEKNRELFNLVAEDYPEITSKKQLIQKVRENEFFNALQIKFAYAVTCHKAQGGQWQNVFIDQGWFTDEMLNIEYLRWFYTAFTRATERLFLINFKQEFLKEQ